ncbi:hypothetical protein ABW19_dt0206819 [Dactylella cylindrospora]|nr:hypothetical protein ABW19_dt0206819 [Dactylella cylindrospora]
MGVKQSITSPFLRARLDAPSRSPVSKKSSYRTRPSASVTLDGFLVSGCFASGASGAVAVVVVATASSAFGTRNVLSSSFPKFLSVGEGFSRTRGEISWSFSRSWFPSS